MRRKSSRIPAVAIYGDQMPPPEMEAEFFAQLRMPNGTFKTTNDRRLDDLNEEILRHLPRGRAIRAKDVGVSSGISTLEWQQALHDAGIECEMTATDAFVDARLIEAWGGLRVLATQGGTPLQLDFRGFVFLPTKDSRKVRLVLALPIAIARHPRLLKLITQKESSLKLVSPRAQALTVLEEDLLDPLPGQWDVIRAANVVNPSYFPEPTLRRMLSGLTESLALHGVLAICRTDPAVGNRASIFRRTENGLRLVSELRGGAEAASLIETPDSALAARA